MTAEPTTRAGYDIHPQPGPLAVRVTVPGHPDMHLRADIFGALDDEAFGRFVAAWKKRDLMEMRRLMGYGDEPYGLDALAAANAREIAARAGILPA